MLSAITPLACVHDLQEAQLSVCLEIYFTSKAQDLTFDI